MENKEYQLEQDRVLKIYRDGNAESPDKWSNTDIFLVYDHRQFTIKRDGFSPQDIFNYLVDNARLDKSELRLTDYDNYFIFPVAAYIHSGVSLSLTDSLKRQGWDTSVRGFILVRKCTDEEPEQNLIESKAKEYAEDLINIWNQYLSGDVWGFKVFKKIKYWKILKEELDKIIDDSCKDQGCWGYWCQCIWLEDFKKKSEEVVELEEEDSCWGFYGSDVKTNGMLDYIKYKLINDDK